MLLEFFSLGEIHRAIMTTDSKKNAADSLKVTENQLDVF